MLAGLLHTITDQLVSLEILSLTMNDVQLYVITTLNKVGLCSHQH